MRALSAQDVLQVWERGEGQHPLDKALLLLSTACPERSWQELAGLSVGQRDALLLTLRELCFGSHLDAFAECPRCQERLEFTVDLAEIRPLGPEDPPEAELTLMAEGFEVRFHLPNSLDLAAIARCDDVDTARQALVGRCVLQAARDETEVAATDLPEAVMALLAAVMVQHDPWSDVQLDLSCPTCGHSWPMVLEIVPFLWTEISAWAQRILGEVHTLARAYGWREADILALSPWRRQRYLEMVLG